MAILRRTTGVTVSVEGPIDVAAAPEVPRAKRGVKRSAVRPPLRQDSAALVSEMQRQDAELVDVVPLRTLPAAKRVKRGAPKSDQGTVTLDVPVSATERAVVLVEDEGDYRWITGTESPSVNVKRGAGPARYVSFRVELTSAKQRRRTKRGIKRNWIADQVIGKATAYVFRFAFNLAGKPLVSFLERNVTRGLVSIGSEDPTQWRLLDDNDPLPQSPPQDRPARVLLMIHGTFSSTVGSYGALGSFDEGRAFLSGALRAYDFVLGFDHPTLSVDPEVNATDLLKRLRKPSPSSRASWPGGIQLDIVAFSRGGLIARTLVEKLLPSARWNATVGRIVFVGCTNSGTQLAEPANWNRFADHYTNIALGATRALSFIPGAQPATTIASQVIRGVGALVKALATGAVTDNVVPGLAAMEPKGPFVTTLNQVQPGQPKAEDANYYAITTTFEPGRAIKDASSGELAPKFLLRVANQGADELYREPNDLVVHVRSMTAFDPGQGDFIKGRLEYGKNGTVYHTNYFAQTKTANKLSEWFEIAAATQIKRGTKRGVKRGAPGSESPRLRSPAPVGRPLPAVAEHERALALIDTLVASKSTALPPPVSESPPGKPVTAPERPSAAPAKESAARGAARRPIARAAKKPVKKAARKQAVKKARARRPMKGNGTPSRSGGFSHAAGLGSRSAGGSRGGAGGDRGAGGGRGTEGGGGARGGADTTRIKRGVPRGSSRAPVRGRRPTTRAPSSAGLGPHPASESTAREATPPNTNVKHSVPVKRGGRGRAKPAAPEAACFFKAEMPGAILVDKAAQIDVIISREMLAFAAGKLSGVAAASVDEEQKVTVELGELHELRAEGPRTHEVKVPEPGKPETCQFTVKGDHAAEAQVVVHFRQGSRPLASIQLTPRVVTELPGDVPRLTPEVSITGFPALEPPLDELRIWEQNIGNTVFYVLALSLPSLGIREEFESKPITSPRDAYVQAIMKDIGDAWIGSQRGGAQAFEADIRSIGGQMFDQLIPREMQQLLWKNRDQIKSVQVISREPFIPWELVYLKNPDEPKAVAGNKFLGELGALRWLQKSFPPSKLRIRKKHARYLVGDAGPGSELPNAEEEARVLRKLFDAQPLAANANDVLKLLEKEDSFDLLHICCHGVAAGEQSSQAQLFIKGEFVDSVFQGDTLKANTVEQTARLAPLDAQYRPIVVLNACESARANRSFTNLGGFAHAFVGAGAGAFIGSHWSIGDRPAFTFIEAMYEAVTQTGNKKLTLSEAVTKARAVARGKDDATWLSYVVYGHPRASVTVE